MRLVGHLQEICITVEVAAYAFWLVCSNLSGEFNENSAFEAVSRIFCSPLFLCYAHTWNVCGLVQLLEVCVSNYMRPFMPIGLCSSLEVILLVMYDGRT